ncbi:MAG: hypothetical protein WC205_05895 [Opitutaceae bacterium]
MNTQNYNPSSPVILSVKVCPVAARLIFVVTSSPKLARAVGDFLQETERNISIVWVPSVASACRRLEWAHASMIILDNDGETNDDAVNALHTADPDAQLMLLAGGSER